MKLNLKLINYGKIVYGFQDKQKVPKPNVTKDKTHVDVTLNNNTFIVHNKRIALPSVFNFLIIPKGNLSGVLLEYFKSLRLHKAKFVSFLLIKMVLANSYDEWFC